MGKASWVQEWQNHIWNPLETMFTHNRWISRMSTVSSSRPQKNGKFYPMLLHMEHCVILVMITNTAENRIWLLMYFSVLDQILYKKFTTSYDSIVCNTNMMISERTIEHLGNDFELIDFNKYLNCLICKKIEFYCMKYRIEVEMILAVRNSIE